MEIKEAQDLVKKHLVEIGYTKIEKNTSQAFLHLSEEVGELARCILHAETERGKMNNKTMPSDLKDELADVFWQILKLAFYLDIDLEFAFIKKYEKNKQKGMPNWNKKEL